MKTYIFTTKGCRQKTPVRVLGFFAVLIGAGCQTPHTSTGTDAQGMISLRHVHTHERLDLPVSLSSLGDGLNETELDENQLALFFRDWRTHQRHTMSPRLISHLVAIAQHFGQPIEIVSAYRAGARTTSRHRHGKAVDFRLAGVSPEVVWRYAKRFQHIGLGLYPKSGFVHIDIRRRSYYWIDDSGPGEPSRYRRGVRQPRISLSKR